MARNINKNQDVHITFGGGGNSGIKPTTKEDILKLIAELQDKLADEIKNRKYIDSKTENSLSYLSYTIDNVQSYLSYYVLQSDFDALQDNIDTAISYIQQSIAQTNIDLNDFKTKEANDITTLNSEIDTIRDTLSQYVKNINVNGVSGHVSDSVAYANISGAVTYVGGTVTTNDIGITPLSTVSYAIDALIQNRGVKFSYDEIGDADYFDENLFN